MWYLEDAGDGRNLLRGQRHGNGAVPRRYRARDCTLSSSSGRGPAAPRASQRQQLRRRRWVGTLGINGRKGTMLIMESEKTVVGRPPAQPFNLYFIIIVCICRS